MFLVFYSKWVGWKCNAFKSYPSDLWQICTTTTKGFGEGSRDWNRTFDLWLTRLYCPKSKNLKVESWLRRSTRNCRLLKAQLRTATYGMYVKWKKKMFSGFNLKITTHQCKVFFSVDSKMFSSIWLEPVKCILRLFWKNRKNIIYYPFRL